MIAAQLSHGVLVALLHGVVRGPLEALVHPGGDVYRSFKEGTYFPVPFKIKSRLKHAVARAARSAAERNIRIVPSRDRIFKSETGLPVISLALASGRTIYVSPRDRRGRELVFSKGAFNAATIEIWRKIIKKRHWTHVVDIGANYGEMLLSVDMPATAKIIVVEPSPRIVPYLEYSLSSAGIPARLFQCAVSDHDGESCLLIDREWSGTSRLGTVPGCPESVSDDIHKLEPITVPTVTLSSILNEPDSAHMTVLIKIDVEGHEISILRGSISAIQKIGYFCALIEILHLPAECLEWLLRHFEVRLATVGGVHFEPVVPNTVATFRRMIETESFHTQDAVIVHRAAG